MENQTIIERLDDKVSQILKKYDELKSVNDTLRTEIVTLKSESELKNAEIARLTDDNAMKELEIEDIMSKIESILG